MDQQNIPDFLKIRQMLAQMPGGQSTASNAPTFDEMPSPLARGPSEDAPQAVAPPRPQAKPMAPAADESDDDTPDAADAPPSDKPDALAGLRVSKEDLQDAADKKRRTLMMGKLADGLSNQASWGAAYLGNAQTHNDNTPYYEKLAAMADQPIEQKKILLKQAMDKPSQDFAMAMQDPNSPESKISKNLALTSIGKLDLPDDQKAQLTKAIQEGNGFQIHQVIDTNPELKQLFTNDAMGKKLDIMAARMEMQQQMMGQNMAIRQQGLDLRTDKAAAGAAGAVVNNKNLDPLVNQARSVDKGLEQLSDPSKPPSWTQIHEVAQDISKALSGGAVSSDFKLKSIDKGSLDEKLGDIMAHYTSNPNQPANPETIAFWKGMGERLKDAYDRQIAGQAQALIKANHTAYGHTPSAEKAANEAAQQYIDGSWRGKPQASAGQSFGQDVIDYAKEHGITPEQAQDIKDKRGGK